MKNSYYWKCVWPECDCPGSCFIDKYYERLDEEKGENMLREDEVLVYEYNEADSSLIRGVGYHPHKLILRIKLVTNPDHYYDYYEVPIKYFAGLIVAESMGGYYNRYIKDKFHCEVTPITEVSVVVNNFELDEISKLVKELAREVVQEATGIVTDLIKDLMVTFKLD